MRTRKHAAPCLEILENRLVPASIRFDGSNLFITNPNITAGATALTITQLPTGAFQVKDNGANNGTFLVTGNLSVTGTAASDKVTVTLDKGAGGTAALLGNLNVRTGNGTDVVTLTTNGNGGRIAGNLNLSFGNGGDKLFADPADTKGLAISGSVQIQGGTGGANNFVEFGGKTAAGQTTFVGGDVSIAGINNVRFGAFATNGGQTFAGNVNIQLTRNTAAFTDSVTAGAFNNFVLLSVSSNVLGNLTVQGNTGSNFVLADSNVGGSMLLNLGNGNNVVELNRGNPAGAVQVFGKDFILTAGNGNNTLLIDPVAALLNIGNNLIVNFGNGNNTYSLPPSLNVAGNALLTAGNGNNVIPFDGTVLGNEVFNLGNGTDSATLSTAPGGSVIWNSGNGTDALTLTGAGFYDIRARFGNSDDTFTLNNAAAVLTGSVDLGGRLTANVFNQIAGTIVGPFVIQNVP